MQDSILATKADSFQSLLFHPIPFFLFPSKTITELGSQTALWSHAYSAPSDTAKSRAVDPVLLAFSTSFRAQKPRHTNTHTQTLAMPLCMYVHVYMHKLIKLAKFLALIWLCI